MTHVLITGGAGFIGSRVATALSGQGANVTVVDCLSEQIHGERPAFSKSLQAVANCVRGDVRDRALMSRLIKGQDAILHLAAETGTGQSMYAVQHYADVNLNGTAVIIDLLVNERPERLRKLVVASSRAIYGEGAYRCSAHGLVYPPPRSAEDLKAGRFDPVCPYCTSEVQLAPTPESAPFSPSSFYGLTKQVQEQMVLMFASTTGIDGVALRYQNVYGPGQSLNNPYTGILAVFSNLARQGKSINVFEDGRESRDFVHVEDVVAATVSVLSPSVRGIHSLNIGSGVSTSVMDVARAVTRHLGAAIPIEVSGAFRLGDIRHNVADISRIRALTGFEPSWDFTSGLASFLDWAMLQSGTGSGYEESLRELQQRGLLGAATS